MVRAGVVLSRQGRTARVQVHASGQCAACACSASRGGEQSSTTRILTVLNIVDAEVGRHVRITDPPRAAVAASVVLFGVPLAGVLGCAFGVNWIAPFSSEDLNSLAGAGLGLITGILAARPLARHVFAGTEYLPRAVEIYPAP